MEKERKKKERGRKRKGERDNKKEERGEMGGNKIRDDRRIRESKGVRFLLCMWLTQTQLPAVHVVPMNPQD